MAKYEVYTQDDFKMSELAPLIDHSLLAPTSTEQELKDFVDGAVKYGFKVVCVNNSNTAKCVELLKGTDISVATVVAYPFGALSPRSKAIEVENAIAEGATIVDMVINIGAVKSGNWDRVYEEMCLCEKAAHKHGVEIKVILECCYLTDEEKVKASELAKKAGLDFVKTSTGYGPTSAVLGDVILMKNTVGTDMGVKASGPIGDYATAVAMLKAGASRIGSRRGIDILKGCPDWRE